MKKIGLIGGISPTSTKIYYDRIISEYYKKYKQNPELIIYSVNLYTCLTLLNNQQYQQLTNIFLSAINSLQKAGADFAAITAVSMHSVIKQVADKSPIPIIDGIKCLINSILKDNKKSILLLGTSYVMNSDAFRECFKAHSIQVKTPTEGQKVMIESVIKDELNKGIVTIESKQKILALIQEYKGTIDSVCLACTALPSIISQSDIPNIPIYDFISTHTQAILKTT